MIASHFSAATTTFFNITFRSFELGRKLTRAVNDGQNFYDCTGAINDSIRRLNEFTKVFAHAFRHAAAQLWELFEVINRRQNSFDGYLCIMRGIAGDEIEYCLKIVGCLKVSNESSSL